MRTDLILEDTTLRDGEQAPGIAFDSKTKVAIFHALIDAGVRWIEPGIPAMRGDEVVALQQMLERRDETMMIGWNRGVLEDIRYTISLGFRAVHIGLPTSGMHLLHSVNKDKSWLMRTAADLVKFAKDQDCFVSISAEDVGRTEISFLQDYAAHVEEAGADRLRLSDTIGTLDARRYSDRVRAVREVATIDLQCHCHNDFGLAVANTLAGLDAGARYFHVCVNGMGERAGMPDLAQTVLALKHFHDVDLGIQLDRLWELSRLVATASGVPLPPWQPVTGTNVFAHESGIHAKGMLADSATFEPFGPEVVGGMRRLVVGKHSGKAVIRHALEGLGIDPRSECLDRCLERARAYSIEIGGEVAPAMLGRIYREIADSDAMVAGASS